MTNKKYSLQEIGEQLEQMRKSKDRLLTGFWEFDALTAGLIKGSLTVVGARPAMGKTALALSIADRLSKQMEGTIVIFSPYRSSEVAVRLLQTGLHMPADKLLDGSLPAEDATDACRSFLESRKGKIKIIPITYRTLQDIDWHCKRIPDLYLAIVVDMKYIFKPDVPGDATAHKPELITMDQSAYALKALAQDLNVPVIATVHLHRRLERRKNMRPQLGDLKWVGLPEEVADQIIFLYRDAYYNWESDDTAECIVAKNTLGKTGTAFLRWIWEGGYFTDQ